MSKTKISEFSTTPGNNTDINGINIAEGCAPSGINNAIRELMSDLKEWQSGAMDVYVIPQGTAAAPGIQLYGDLDTGLYGFAANQLGVAVGGASAGYFSSAGWVGNVNGTITGDINATTIDTTNLEVTNIKAKDGTAAITIADSTSVVTFARTTSATNSVNEMLVLEHYSTGTIAAGFGSGIKFFGENTGGGNSVYAAIHAVWEGTTGNPSGGALAFLTDGYVGDNTERMRITSEGSVGIGTPTPSTTLHVVGSATISGATTLSATTQNIALGTSQTTGTFTVGGAAQTGTQTVDQSTKTHTLNVGSGATENGLTKTVNIATGGVSGSTTAITIGSTNGTTTTLNGTVTAATLNSTTIDTTNIEVTNIKAKDGTASITLADSTGQATFSANPLLNAGTANGVPYLNASKVLTTGSALTFDGTNLGIGTSSPTAAYGYTRILDVAGQFPGVKFTPSGTSTFGFQIGAGTGGFQFYDVTAAAERARISSDGTFRVKGAGTAGSTDAVQFSGSAPASAMTLDASGRNLIGLTSTQSNNARLQVKRTDATVGATTYSIGWLQNATGYQDGLNVLATDQTVILAADYAGTNHGTSLLFATNSGASAFGATERARITSGGDFQTSSGNSVMIGGTAARATTAGTNRLDIFNGTAPVGTLANGVSFYSTAGEARVMDAAGNATLLSPHDTETNEWIFHSKHTPTGKVLRIDVERLLKFVNDHFGLDAVQEFIEE